MATPIFDTVSAAVALAHALRDVDRAESAVILSEAYDVAATNLRSDAAAQVRDAIRFLLSDEAN